MSCKNLQLIKPMCKRKGLRIRKQKLGMQLGIAKANVDNLLSDLMLLQEFMCLVLFLGKLVLNTLLRTLLEELSCFKSHFIGLNY